MEKMGKWTMKETLLGKTRTVIILTAILTFIMNKVINRIMTKEVAVEGGLYSSYTYEFSLGIYGLVFAIPAGFLSILIVMIFMNLIKGKPSGTFHHQKEFKWYSIYGTITGFVLLFLIINFNPYTSEMQVTNVWEGFLWVGLEMLIPIAIAVTAAKLINIVMVRITNTNGMLIEEIKTTGKHAGMFSSEEEKNRVLKQLKKGNASTIKGALRRLKINDFFLMVGGGFIALFVILSKAIPKVENKYTGWNQEMDKAHQAKKQIKSEANRAVEQKRKKANYSGRKFVDQFNYNAKYSKSEENRYKQDLREYEEARKRAERL
ncbi:hypothetical protein [Virgibacillus kimchii]